MSPSGAAIYGLARVVIDPLDSLHAILFLFDHAGILVLINILDRSQ
jgi:hypothetical protein